MAPYLDDQMGPKKAKKFKPFSSSSFRNGWILASQSSVAGDSFPSLLICLVLTRLAVLPLYLSPVTMLVKISIKKTKNFFHKSLQSIRSLLFGKHHKGPNHLILNPLSCSNAICPSQSMDHISSSDLVLAEDSASEDQKEAKLPINVGFDEQPSQSASGGSFRLANKMKVLEMMNVGDVDHTLDVEEALHYYSRLTCPVYLDMVDKFFMDMYKDFYIPQLSRSLRSSSVRLGSSRRLGPLVL